MSLIDRGVLTTPPSIGLLCRSVCAQSTTQPWYTDTLTPLHKLYEITQEFRLEPTSMCKDLAYADDIVILSSGYSEM